MFIEYNGALKNILPTLGRYSQLFALLRIANKFANIRESRECYFLSVLYVKVSLRSHKALNSFNAVRLVNAIKVQVLTLLIARLIN